MNKDEIKNSFITASKLFGKTLFNGLADLDIGTSDKYVCVYQVRGEVFSCRYQEIKNFEEALFKLLQRAAVPLLIQASEEIEALQVDLGRSKTEKPTFTDDLDYAFWLFSNSEGIDFKILPDANFSNSTYPYSVVGKIGGVVYTTNVKEKDLSRPEKKICIKVMIPHLMNHLLQKYDNLVKEMESPENNTRRLFGDPDIKKRKIKE